MSTFAAGAPCAVDSIFILDGVWTVLSGLIGLSEPLRFSRSRASSSASENCLRCFGLKGLGVETRDDRNWMQQLVSHTPGRF